MWSVQTCFTAPGLALSELGFVYVTVPKQLWDVCRSEVWFVFFCRVSEAFCQQLQGKTCLVEMNWPRVAGVILRANSYLNLRTVRTDRIPWLKSKLHIHSNVIVWMLILKICIHLSLAPSLSLSHSLSHTPLFNCLAQFIQCRTHTTQIQCPFITLVLQLCWD